MQASSSSTPPPASHFPGGGSSGPSQAGPSSNPPTKKRTAPQSEQATVAKRQRSKDKKEAQAAQAAATRKLFWTGKGGEKLATWRRSLVGLVGNAGPRQALIATLNKVRELSARRGLNAAEKLSIPDVPQLYTLLLDIFLNPVSWKPEQHQLALRKVVGEELEVLESGTMDTVGRSAQYYIRRFPFEKLADFQKVLREPARYSPQYTAQATFLLDCAEAFGAPEEEVALHYGGFTVANTPEGRALDDYEDEETEALSFVKIVTKIFASYIGPVEVFEVMPLRFEVASEGPSPVIQSRADVRTSLFETLVVDAFAGVCMNTAQPGGVLDCHQHQEEEALLAAISL